MESQIAVVSGVQQQIIDPELQQAQSQDEHWYDIIHNAASIREEDGVDDEILSEIEQLRSHPLFQEILSLSKESLIQRITSDPEMSALRDVLVKISLQKQKHLKKLRTQPVGAPLKAASQVTVKVLCISTATTVAKQISSKATFATQALITVGELAYWTFQRYGSKTPISTEMYKDKLKTTLINNAAGAAGGIIGTSGGAYLGAFIGSFLGPAGMVIGGTIGGIIGCVAVSTIASVTANYFCSDRALIQAEAERMTQRQYFQQMCSVLTVTENTPKKVVKQCFKGLIKANHPDHFQQAEKEFLREKEKRSAQIISAYRFIQLYRTENGTWND
ncbi:hypothetical protein FGO68_gene7311 [Halteria grandinella]|uniref:J domain-containing protein n=1 Tax=Halteria grandinella TaxID=5974 RepID=A0A8J8NLZ5_HALGN|nr:hypothetical protein FGO68_gene7311 [Halteria grandinella]